MADEFDLFEASEEKKQFLNSIVHSVRNSKHPPLKEFTYDADDWQQDFIDSESRFIRLLAPAGSGKTQSIVNRVLDQISKGADPNSFLIVTFDNSGSASLQSKFLESLEGTEAGKNVVAQVMTLNAFGYRLLRNELRDSYAQYELDVDHNAVGRSTIRRVLKDLQQRDRSRHSLLPKNLAPRVYLDFVSHLKNGLVVPEDLKAKIPEAQERYFQICSRQNLLTPWVESNGGNGTSNLEEKVEVASKVAETLAWIYITYCETMRNQKRIDFDDQKLLPYLAFREDLQLAGAVCSRYEYVIVDEFQDINFLDFELIKMIAEGRHLIAVGDDDQAIYAFRGCSPDFIIDFEGIVRDWAGESVETVILERNYRCPKNVVEMANRVISNNVRRVNKRQVAVRDDDVDVSLWHTVNAASEAQIIARFIKTLTQKKRAAISYSNIAVLFRMNSQSLPLQLALILEEIPYHCRKQDNIVISDTMKNVLGLIKLHLKLRDDPGHFSKADTYLLADTFFRYVDQKSTSRFAYLVEQVGSYRRAARVTKIDRFNWSSFGNAVDFLNEPSTPERFVKGISENFKYMGGLVGTLEEAVDNFVPLGELVDIASRFRGSTEQFHSMLSGLLSKVEGGLYRTKEGEGVNLLTYFKSKGRQWHTVILPGVNEGVIPHGRGDTEDERRLFYVGITRASSNLVLSYVRKAVGQDVGPSRFLKEMGLEVEGQEKRAPELRPPEDDAEDVPF